MNAPTQFLDALKNFRGEGFDNFALFTHALLETNFSTDNAVKRNNFFNQYSYPGDGWKGDTYGTGDEDASGKGIKVLSKVFLTPLDGLYDLKDGLQKKFPLMYPDRANYIKYFNGIMTLGDFYNDNGKQKKKILYPSFCDSWTYSPDNISLYERKKREQPDLYEIITNA